MTTGADRPLAVSLRRFPGAVLQVDPGGIVLDSNGRLESALGREIVGRRFADALDVESCGAKWARILAGEVDAGSDEVWELILRGRDTLPEPRGFSALRESPDGDLWLVEHPRDARLDRLREQVTDVNSDLASTQRELVKERGRLRHAYTELEAQSREQERLSHQLQERNAQIEAQNEELLAATNALHARQEELERSNRALDEFAHVVSHDLKAPLRAIANYASWIEEDTGPLLGDEAAAHLELLRVQVQRMRALIDGLLEYARAGRVAHRPEPVDLGELVREVIELLDPPPTVAIDVAGGLPTLRTDRAPLRQVLQNLVDNAIAHADAAQPRVTISVRPGGAQVEVTVADNGPGVPPRLRERIWTLFHTTGPKGGRGGTGIGLAVVRRLVEARGGRTWVEDSGEGGAAFRFLWPANENEVRLSGD